MKIEIEIPDANVSELAEYFLYLYPVPIDEETGEPTHTTIQWFKSWLYKQIVNAYHSGKKRKMWDEFQVTYDLE